MMNSWCLVLAVLVGLLFVITSAIDDNCTEYYRSDGPQITPCKEEVILQYGQTYTLKCRANTPVEFIKQESPEENYGNFTYTAQSNFSYKNAEYKYETNLELKNVDIYAIGFYACIRKDNTIDKEILNQLVEEPKNTAEISYVYIYVNGTDFLFAPMRTILISKKKFYVAECRPTTPDVEVDITYVDAVSQNKTPKYLVYSPKIGFKMAHCSKKGFKCTANKTGTNESATIRSSSDATLPTIISGYKEFLLGETFSLNCSATYDATAAVHLEWKLPNDSLKVNESTNNNIVTSGKVYRNIIIENATSAYAGIYTCSGTSHCLEKGSSVSVEKIFIDKPYMESQMPKTETYLKETKQLTSGFAVYFKSYPPASYTFYKDGIPLQNSTKFEIKKNARTGDWSLKIHKENVEDSGHYTVKVTNGHSEYDKNLTYDIRFKDKPNITFDTSDKTCVLNTTTSLLCEVKGYPLPSVKWIFNNDAGQVYTQDNTTVKKIKLYQEEAILNIECRMSGVIMCEASNEINSQNKTRKLLVYELPGGFGIYDQNEEKILRFSENQVATVKCVASLFHFYNVTWEKVDGDLGDEMVEYSHNNFSHVAILNMKQISLQHSGKYVCRGLRFNGTGPTSDEVEIKVAHLQEPQVVLFNEITEDVQTFQSIYLYCQAEGVPQPNISWLKDNVVFNPLNDSNIVFQNNIFVDYKTVNSSIYIRNMKEGNFGEYTCVASNTQGSVLKEVKRTAKLTLKEAAYIKYVIAIAVILVVLVIMVIYLTCKVKKEKRFRKELAAAGLLYFKEGVTKSLNPDLGIDEQAELLPYNEKFEFPADKLTLGKQLGAGAFGVVYKAEARGIINAEESTPVAVKMVKKTADNMYIKALASELKIMVHLGKHINIVNLLGACTKNVGKRELVVIVEYCKFGNIHNYMQRHREVFIDQLSDSNKEKSFGKVNRGYDSSGSTGLHSDYGTANTQDTDHTFLTNNTNQTSRKTSESYVQPEWRSNYESDYSYDGRSPRPLTSRDLLAWAFQIARGMEYLARRKVLHGDLAARNILLADDNIVKICDFGLAKSIYKNDEYQKKENSLLPVKWLAIECMTDRIFSTQSDVWSFGIVLWELFTLAKTPYPNMSPAHLLHFLREGQRLEKPAYSDDRIYNLMKRCWEEKPTTRPSFTQLQETLGTFLEDNVRNHYVDLNATYIDGNSPPEGQEDYLAMVSAPDYNNMVTPSPHHYVNEIGDPKKRFFPPTPTDEDGYLQMSPAHIFSPKAIGTKFDFEPRKFNTRPSEASSGGSELTPMLTLNNLPRSGSDSDHEGNTSPFPNVCARIDEEPDEVFDNKHSKQTLNQNAKNVQITNATNPMYITFDLDKKPIENSYANMVPNGLVN